MEPLDGSLILPYAVDMEPQDWLDDMIWPIMRWDSKEKLAYDPLTEHYYEITAWLPFPELPKDNE